VRWFKHMCDSVDNEKMVNLLDRLGAEGYGLYFLALRAIAAQLKPESRSTSLQYPVSKWAAVLHTRPQEVGRKLQILADVGLLKVRCGGAGTVVEPKWIAVDAPNLLIYLDEYTRKSGATPDKIPPDIDTEPKSDAEGDTDIHDGLTGKHSSQASPSQKSQKQKQPQPHLPNLPPGAPPPPQGLEAAKHLLQALDSQDRFNDLSVLSKWAVILWAFAEKRKLALPDLKAFITWAASNYNDTPEFSSGDWLRLADRPAESLCNKDWLFNRWKQVQRKAAPKAKAEVKPERICDEHGFDQFGYDKNGFDRRGVENDEQYNARMRAMKQAETKSSDETNDDKPITAN
jgi:hypothetical protein